MVLAACNFTGAFNQENKSINAKHCLKDITIQYSFLFVDFFFFVFKVKSLAVAITHCVLVLPSTLILHHRTSFCLPYPASRALGTYINQPGVRVQSPYWTGGPGGNLNLPLC